jgi:hypothetical protein
MLSDSHQRRSQALSSLAILKEDIDSNRRDYLDYLAAFVKHVIAKERPTLINDESIETLLLKDFGLRFPRKGIQLVLSRLVRNGDLTLSERTLSLKENGDGAVKLLEERRGQAMIGITTLTTELQNFAKNLGIEWSPDQALAALTSFLAQFAITYLRAYIFETALPEFSSEGSVTERYVVGKFIKTASTSDHKLFESVIVLVKGQMYANALLCPDLQGVGKNFKSVKFFLDTPLVLGVLGLHGDYASHEIRELMTLVKRLDGVVYVFSHLVAEVVGVITYAARNIDRSTANGRVIKNCRIAGLRASDLFVMANTVEQKLTEQNLMLFPTPNYEHAVQISEVEFQGALEEEIAYRTDQAVYNDINSVRSVYALRGNIIPVRLEDAVAVLVTSNSALARTAFEFGKNHNSTKEVSSVIKNFALANIAWLKSPLDAPDLPVSETLAACYAALEPSTHVWGKYLSKLEELDAKGDISSEEHAILRSSPIVAEEIMDMSVREDASVAFSGGNIREILDRIQESLTIEKDRQLLAANEQVSQLAEQKSSADNSALVYRDQVAKLTDDLHLLQTTQLAIQQNQSRMQSDLQAASTKVSVAENKSQKLASLVAWTITKILFSVPVFIFLFFGLASGAGLLNPLGLTTDKSQIAYLIVFVVTAISTLALVSGYSFKGLSSRVHSWVLGKLDRYFDQNSK